MEKYQSRSAAALSSAFQVRPEVVEEAAPPSASSCDGGNVGIYGWKTPQMEGFELPASDDLIVALHLGGSRRVRAITNGGLSRCRSAPGLLTILPPGRSAAFRTEGSISLMSLHVPGTLVSEFPQPPGNNRDGSWLPRFAFRDPYVSASLEALLSTARSGQAVRPDYVVKMVDAMLSHLAQARQSQDAVDVVELPPELGGQRVGRITLRDLFALIDAQLGRNIGLDELARCTGLSRAAFTRCFRQVTGISAHQALNQRRIEVAKRLLAQTGLDLAYVAQETGWSSQSHFTASFRKAVGCTPARYRALC
ncbi:MAG: hypothetical protein C0434_13390 [Xanthomonadaceae bacterium]|nr:hypothetical protein [Xanthomonadaceae bacterium]